MAESPTTVQVTDQVVNVESSELISSVVTINTQVDTLVVEQDFVVTELVDDGIAVTLDDDNAYTYRLENVDSNIQLVVSDNFALTTTIDQRVTTYKAISEEIEIQIGSDETPLEIRNYFLDKSILAFGPSGRVVNYLNFVETKNIDSNGYVIFYPTNNGLSSGTPLFTSIVSVNAIAIMPAVGTMYTRPQVNNYEIDGVLSVRVYVTTLHRQVLFLGDVAQINNSASNTSIQVQCTISGVLDAQFLQ